MQSSYSMFRAFVYLASRLFSIPGTTHREQPGTGGRVSPGPGKRLGAAPSSGAGPGRVAAPAVVPQPPWPQQVGPGRRAGRSTARHRGAFRERLRDASAEVFIVCVE